MTGRIIAVLDFKSAVQYMKYLIYNFSIRLIEVFSTYSTNSKRARERNSNCKRTRESELMFLPPVSFLCPAYERKYLFISSNMPEQVSDRPARTPRVVLAVASHDSLRVRFLLTAGCKFGLIPKKQISSTTPHTAGGSFLHGHTLVFCLSPCFPGLVGGLLHRRITFRQHLFANFSRLRKRLLFF